MLNLDISVGLLLLLGVVVARLRGDRLTWRMFWLGCGLGMVCELGFFLDGPLFTGSPSYHMMQAYPVHPWLQPLGHALWDGGILLVGSAAVRLLCHPPHFVSYRWKELAVMLVWGNAQELAVELTATHLGMWSFVAKPWNPHLLGLITLSATATPTVHHTARPMPAATWAVIAKMAAAGTQMMAEPMTGMKPATTVVMPKKTAWGTPVTKKPTATTAPMMAEVTRELTKAALDTSISSLVWVARSGDTRHKKFTVEAPSTVKK